MGVPGTVVCVSHFHNLQSPPPQPLPYEACMILVLIFTGEKTYTVKEGSSCGYMASKWGSWDPPTRLWPDKRPLLCRKKLSPWGHQGRERSLEGNWGFALGCTAAEQSCISSICPQGFLRGMLTRCVSFCRRMTATATWTQEFC